MYDPYEFAAPAPPSARRALPRVPAKTVPSKKKKAARKAAKKR
jgi:hypothetical protein